MTADNLTAQRQSISRAWAHVTGYAPHAGQRGLHDDGHRFRILRKGRRGGGTTAGAHEAAVELQLHAGLGAGDIGIFAPSSDKCELIFDRLMDALYRRQLLGPGRVTRVCDALGNRRIETAWGARIVAFSLASGLPGEGWGFRFLIVDEAQDLDIDTWNTSLRPTLAEYQGRALFIGKATGPGFHALHSLAEEFPEDWAVHSFPSSSNPMIDEAEIEAARREMPAAIFAQEYLAEWSAAADRVFTWPDYAVQDLPNLEGPQPERIYCDGWDLARKVDEAAGYTIDATGVPLRVASWWHGREPWPILEQRIVDRWRTFDSYRVAIDATGVGDAVYGHLDIPDAVLEPFIFTGPRKSSLLWHLAALLEKGQLTIPNHPKLLRQLREYRYDDANLETDLVMGLALAAHAAAEQPATVESWCV